MFKLNLEKCIKCGLCTADCITGAIEKDENKNPMMKHTDKCIKCQHCFMICPVGAITFNNVKSEDVSEIQKEFNSDEILNLIKSRRSIRKFKDENVNPETIQKLKDMLKFAPTGCNNHKLVFSFIEDKDVMEDFRQKVNSKLIKLFNKKPVKFLINKTNKFSKYKDAFLNGEDIIYRNSPHMVVVSAPLTSPCPNQDGVISLSYFELYANSLNLGTLWCGYAQAALKMFPEFCEYLKIPNGYIPIYCMLFGYKDVEYKRESKPAEYEFIEVQKQDIKMSAFEKFKRFFINGLR